MQLIHNYLQKLCIKCVFVDNEMNFNLSSFVILLKEEFSVEQQLTRRIIIISFVEVA